MHMAILKWNAELDTGIDVIDGQHRRIVDYVNQLHEAREHGDAAAVGEVIESTVEYTLSHFAFEESLMEDAGYPLSKPHKRVHELFVKRVADLDVTTFAKATESLKTVDSALAFISGERAKLGALQSRFETTVSNLQVTSENLSASRSRILDADFAAETAMLSKAQILQQAGTAMVAQANQLPQGVLALLR